MEANKIRALRIKKTPKGLTVEDSREEFGKLLGVSGHAVRSWEEGKRTPGGAAVKLLKQISKEN